jgi:hypothetical protein
MLGLNETDIADVEILAGMQKTAATKYFGILKNMAHIKSNTQDVFKCGSQNGWSDCVTIVLKPLTSEPFVYLWYDTADKSSHIVNISWADLVQRGYDIKREHEAGK